MSEHGGGEHGGHTVATEFVARDAGYTATLAKISSSFEHAAHRLEHVKERIGEFRKEQGMTTLAMLGLGVGLGAWVEKAKEANAEFGRTQKSIAGVLAGALQFDRGTSELERYNRSLKLSAEITEELDHTAARFVMPLEDVAGAYRTTAQAAGTLGLSQQEVMEITEAAVATAKRFGESGQRAATEIARALQTGKVRGFDPFAIALRQSIGDMRKLNQEARLEHLQKALHGSVAIADAMSGGITGALTRAREVVEEVFRDATGPLFKEIAKHLENWAKHIREARHHAKPMIDMFADKLVAAFHTFEKVSAFIKEHWIAIGAVFAGLKAGELAGKLGGMLSGAGAAAGGIGALMPFAGGLGRAGGMFSTIGALAPALGGIVTAAGLATIALKGVYDEWQSRKQQAAELSGFFDEMGKVTRTQQYLKKHDAQLTPEQIETGRKYADAHAKTAAEILKSKGLWEDGRIQMERFNGVMASLSEDLRGTFTEKLGLAGLGDVSTSMLGAAAAEILAKTVNEAPIPGLVSEDDKRKFAKAPITNIYGGIQIQQKFEGADPDKVFIRFKADLEAGISRKTQSVEGEAESH